LQAGVAGMSSTCFQVHLYTELLLRNFALLATESVIPPSFLVSKSP